MATLPLHALLEFVDECDLSDSALPDSPPTCERHGSSSRSIQKLQSRNVREIASLQAQLAPLSLQLKQLQAARSIGAHALLKQGCFLQAEAEQQSRKRSTAQEENERLRDQLQALKQVATRLVNMMKRRPMIRVRGLPAWPWTCVSLAVARSSRCSICMNAQQESAPPGETQSLIRRFWRPTQCLRLPNFAMTVVLY